MSIAIEVLPSREEITMSWFPILGVSFGSADFVSAKTFCAKIEETLPRVLATTRVLLRDLAVRLEKADGFNEGGERFILNAELNMDVVPVVAEMEFMNYTISQADFVLAVYYFLTNVDLAEDDPREQLVDLLKH